MILLTGATGTVGSALLRRLTRGRGARPLPGARSPPPRRSPGARAAGHGRPRGPALVPQRAPRGAHGDPPGRVDPRRAAGVDRGAERHGHAPPGARGGAGGRAAGSCSSRRSEPSTTRCTRFFRAKALAEQAVETSALETGGVLALDRLHARAIPGSPCSSASPTCPPSRCPARATRSTSRSGRRTWPTAWWRRWPRTASGHRRYELAGPQTLSYDDIVRVAMRPTGRRRRLLHVPLPVVRASLRGLGRAVGPRAFATWEEAELMEEPMTTAAARPTPSPSGSPRWRCRRWWAAPERRARPPSALLDLVHLEHVGLGRHLDAALAQRRHELLAERLPLLA